MIARPITKGFVAVQISPPAGVATRQSTMVRLGSGVQIELGTDFAVAEMVVRELLQHALRPAASAGGETC